MILSWKNYILSHQHRTEYDKSANVIQEIIDPKLSADANFKLLSDHPWLVCLTRSFIGRDIQASFYHNIKKASLLSSDYENFALMGFGPRACAMRVDPKEMFKSSTIRKVPSFNQIVLCESVEDFLALKPTQTMDEGRLEAHAVIPPILLEAFLVNDSVKAEDVLLSFVRKVKELKGKSDTASVSCSSEVNSIPETNENSLSDLADEIIANMRVPTENTGCFTRSKSRKPKADTDREGYGEIGDSSNESRQSIEKESRKKNEGECDIPSFDSENKFYESRFGRIFQFLWGVIHEDKLVKATRMTPCSKHSTLQWLDHLHDSCIQTMSNLPPPPQFPTIPTPSLPDSTGFQNAAIAFTKFSDVMERKMEADIQAREQKEKEKDEKSFDNLSDVQKKILTLITVKETDTDKDLDNLHPTEATLNLLKHSISIKAQAQLQHEFSKYKHICDISLAMCTHIKNGIIASHPSVSDINGISPFFLPDQSEDDRIGYELALRLEEQMSHGKISDADLKIITKCKIQFPNNFGEYIHYIKNFHRLILILSGEKSLLTQSMMTVLNHAIENERDYKDLEKDYWHFYASILEFIHKRCQHYIHSAGLGVVSKLKRHKLNFSEFLENIEDGDYIPSIPKWLKTKKRASSQTNTPGTSSGARSNNNQKQNTSGSENNSSNRPRKKAKGPTIDNPNLVPELKIPADLPYRQVFHPSNRRGIEEVNHSDGTIKCNNWWFRGWCTENCTLKESHSKTLSNEEVKKCKEYLQKLITRHKDWAQSRQTQNNQGQ